MFVVTICVLTSVAGNLRCGIGHGCQEGGLSCIWEADGESTQEKSDI